MGQGIWFNRGEEDRRYFLKRLGCFLNSQPDRSLNHLTAAMNNWITICMFRRCLINNQDRMHTSLTIKARVTECIKLTGKHFVLVLCFTAFGQWQCIGNWEFISHKWLSYFVIPQSTTVTQRIDLKRWKWRECNNIQAYFRGITAGVLAWNWNPYHNIILFGFISRSTVQTEWFSPLLN